MQLSRFTIRTSDRRVFRRCPRKWGFMSSLKDNLQRKGAEQNINFWFGSAIHYAMEDFHGWNRFGDPRRAFKAYYDCFKPEERPGGSDVMYDIGIGMLTYYLEWYPRKNATYGFETLWLKDGKAVEPFTEGAEPAVEQQFFLDLDIKVVVDKKTEQIICEYKSEMESISGKSWPQIVKVGNGFNLDDVYKGPNEEFSYYYFENASQNTPIEVLIVPIHYHGTIDKIVVDRQGRWWLLDYKTAKGADTNKLDTDDQISAYMWAAEQWFQHKIHGFIYLQLTKDVTRPPRRLKNGDLSIDKKQKTTYALVKQAIIDEFGSVKQAPNKYIDFLNNMADKESPEGDRFIRWDFVRRSDAQLASTYKHIMGELRTMINPDFYRYPSPTRDCIWDCPLRDICLAMDRDEMSEVELALQNYEKRPRGEEGKVPEWQTKLVYPDKPLGLASDVDFADELDRVFDVILPDKYLEDDGKE